ncbi:HupE/UreJ family protein [Ruegeria marisrubri]|uniref:HupE/UreJ family protein n=1 Tax=Ruegeria marisrubri TaxID=1685379 RepID=UPI001CD4C525|nr:HupE/UreJ family protein [Ruegeria marisrubri]MCA0906760.1 HupE/UreJ family protein [Ruegeria marisrubri]
MNGPVFRAILRAFNTCALSFIVLLTLHPGSVKAQTAPPTVIDFWVKDDTLFLEVKLNAEAMLVGADPTQPDAYSGNSKYRSLRRMVSSELEPQIRNFVQVWKQNLVVEAPERLDLSYEGVRIPVVGDVEKVRVSKLLLTSPLSDQASNLRLTWPLHGGSVVLRQQKVVAPYTGFLAAGEISPLIPLRGGASLTTEQTLQTYFAMGISRFVQSPLKPTIVVLTLVMLTLSLRPVMSQVAFWAAGGFVGLGLDMYGVLDLPESLQDQALVTSIIILALWNLVARRLQVWRLLAVLAAGCVYGLALASDLTKIGVPPDHLAPAVLGFGVGNILPVVFVAVLAFACALLVAGGSHRKRGRISVLASMLIAGIGVYWMAEPWLLA